MTTLKTRHCKIKVDLYKAIVYCYVNLPYQGFLKVLKSKFEYDSDLNFDDKEDAAISVQIDDNCYVIWIEKFRKTSTRDLSYLVHEVCHVSDFILESREINKSCSETFAYLVEYIFYKLYNLLVTK